MANTDAIDKIFDKMKKTFPGEAFVFSELDEFSTIKRWVSFGVPELDLLVETFGIPPGITEVSGDPQSGKTTMALHFAREVQMAGGLIIILSTERRDNEYYARAIGLDTSRTVILKAKTIEACFAKIETVVDIVNEVSTDVPVALILDSLGGTPTKAEMAVSGAEEGKDFMAVAARVIKQGLRRVTQLMDEYDAILFIVNQTYDKVGVVFGRKRTSYGGKGVKFHAQLRMEVESIQTLAVGSKEKRKKIGQISRVTLLKSDFSKPWRHVDLTILFGYGIVPGKEMLEFGAEYGILKENGTGYRMAKFPKYSWKSMESYYDLCMEDATFRSLLRRMLLNKVHELIREKREKERATS